MMILFSRAHRQILQTLHLNDRWIAQALKSQLDQLEKLSKKQKAELHEHWQIMFEELNLNEAQVQKELNQEKAWTQEKA